MKAHHLTTQDRQDNEYLLQIFSATLPRFCPGKKESYSSVYFQGILQWSVISDNNFSKHTPKSTQGLIKM